MSEYGRTIDLKVEIDLWDWPSGSISETIDIAKDLESYRFQKTIKSPEGSCQMSILPQRAETHIMDVISPMDVVRIYEFDALKFVGYVVRVSYDGSIGGDGKPNRKATITCRQFGGLFASASVGMGLGTALGYTDDPLIANASKLFAAIADSVDEDGTTFEELFTILYNNFRSYLEDIGASNFNTYLDHYYEVGPGLVSATLPAIPRQFRLYTGQEQSLTFWQLAEQIVQRPFNELWMDNGERAVHIDGANIELPRKVCPVFRPAPFNGTVSDATTDDGGIAWEGVPTVNISSDYLLRFDLARSMEEVFTFYSVKEPTFNLSDMFRLLSGIAKVDEDRVGRYLFKPYITELFYTRVLNSDGDAQQITQGQAETAGEQAAQTLYNWFNRNEDYLSGVIQMMVPSESDLDPRIGQKIRVYGIEGAFYVEGVAHTWNYQGPLKTDLTVTRGYNYERNRRIELKDRIFKRSVIR